MFAGGNDLPGRLVQIDGCEAEETSRVFELQLPELRKAVEAGFHDRERIAREPDLASLAQDPGFQELLASLPATPRE